MHGYKGSTAEDYAQANNIPFVYIISPLHAIDAESTISGENIVISLHFEHEIVDKEIICAFYDNDGRMVKATIIPVSRKADNIYVATPDSEEIATAKIMARMSLASAEPSTLAATLDIVR